MGQQFMRCACTGVFTSLPCRATRVARGLGIDTVSKEVTGKCTGNTLCGQKVRCGYSYRADYSRCEDIIGICAGNTISTKRWVLQGYNRHLHWQYTMWVWIVFANIWSWQCGRYTTHWQYTMWVWIRKYMELAVWAFGLLVCIIGPDTVLRDRAPVPRSSGIILRDRASCSPQQRKKSCEIVPCVPRSSGLQIPCEIVLRVPRSSGLQIILRDRASCSPQQRITKWRITNVEIPWLVEFARAPEDHLHRKTT